MSYNEGTEDCFVSLANADIDESPIDTEDCFVSLANADIDESPIDTEDCSVSFF